MSDERVGYGLTQEEAKAQGAPICPECGRLADAISETYYFMDDVCVARCTPCRLWKIHSIHDDPCPDEPWIQFPAKDDPDWAGKTKEAAKQLDARRKIVRERRRDAG